MHRSLTIAMLAAAAACTSPGSARTVKDDSASASAGGIKAAPASSTTAQPAASAADSTVHELQRRADRSRILGDTMAAVWMVEVSDFQCPYCARFHAESYAQLRQDYISNGRVKLAYINFPLPMHANAFPAAEAALCAGAQGKFWQMHDALFSSQDAWSQRASAVTLFDTLAAGVGVALPAFQRCMRDHVMAGLVQQDVDRGRESGIRSTPTFFIGDTAILGAQPTPVFRQVLDSAIARAARGRGAR